MAWNEPGGSGNGNGNGRDPWGNRGGNDQGPPDLDEVVKNIRNKVGGLFGSGGGSSRGSDQGSSGAGGIVSLIIFLLVVWFVYDASYIVDQKERGVVLRFGKYVDTMQPGFNMRLPRPIEDVVVVNVDNIRSANVGVTSSESYMLTQDENIVDIALEVQYRIKDPKDYVFNVADPDGSLKQAIESAVREVVGRNVMDFIITGGRDEIGIKAELLVQAILDNYGTGIEITRFNMQKSKEPEEVRAAFADAVKAQADAERYKNEAQAYQREVLGKARGASQREILDAQAYRARVVASSTGEASRFEQLLTEYRKAPQVTRERLYIETMESVLSNSTKIMTDTSGNGKGGSNNLLYLPLDKLMNRSKTTGPSTDQWSPDSTPSRGQSGLPSGASNNDPRSRGAR